MSSDQLQKDIESVLGTSSPKRAGGSGFFSAFDQLNREYAERYGSPFEVTGEDTREHLKFHGGQARDIRSKTLNPEQRKFIVSRARDLGLEVKDFSWVKGPTKTPTGVTLTGPHIHLQRPKAPASSPDRASAPGLNSDIQSVLSKPSRSTTPPNRAIGDREPGSGLNLDVERILSNSGAPSVASPAPASGDHPIFASALNEVMQSAGIGEQMARAFLKSKQGQRQYPGLKQIISQQESSPAVNSASQGAISDFIPGSLELLQPRTREIIDNPTVTAAASLNIPGEEIQREPSTSSPQLASAALSGKPHELVPSQKIQVAGLDKKTATPEQVKQKLLEAIGFSPEDAAATPYEFRQGDPRDYISPAGEYTAVIPRPEYEYLIKRAEDAKRKRAQVGLPQAQAVLDSRTDLSPEDRAQIQSSLDRLAAPPTPDTQLHTPEQAYVSPENKRANDLIKAMHAPAAPGGALDQLGSALGTGLDYASRPFQYASTLVAGLERKFGTALAAPVSDAANEQGQKYGFMDILDAANERFYTGKVRPGFEQPVEELFKLAVEHYGGNPETATNQLIANTLGGATDPVNYGAIETIAGKLGARLSKAKPQGFVPRNLTEAELAPRIRKEGKEVIRNDNEIATAEDLPGKATDETGQTAIKQKEVIQKVSRAKSAEQTDARASTEAGILNLARETPISKMKARAPQRVESAPAPVTSERITQNGITDEQIQSAISNTSDQQTRNSLESLQRTRKLLDAAREKKAPIENIANLEIRESELLGRPDVRRQLGLDELGPREIDRPVADPDLERLKPANKISAKEQPQAQAPQFKETTETKPAHEMTREQFNESHFLHGSNSAGSRQIRETGGVKKGFLIHAADPKATEIASFYEKNSDLSRSGKGSVFVVPATNESGLLDSVEAMRNEGRQVIVGSREGYPPLRYSAEVPAGVDPHRYLVDKAIKEGKPVPPEVLKDYPDLERLKPATADIDRAAHEAATSPENKLPEPTEAQIEAGNYAKGHARIAGMEISIENPAGSKRRPEWPDLTSHYGYIRRTTGADAEQLDVFIKQGTPEDYSGPVFVVDQTGKGGKFDEHKVMLGFTNEASARAGYSENYTKGWKVGPIRKFDSPAEFREWLNTADTTKPAAEASTPSPEKASGAKVGEVEKAQSEFDQARVKLDELNKRRRAGEDVRADIAKQIKLTGNLAKQLEAAKIAESKISGLRSDIAKSRDTITPEEITSPHAAKSAEDLVTGKQTHAVEAIAREKAINPDAESMRLYGVEHRELNRKTAIRFTAELKKMERRATQSGERTIADLFKLDKAEAALPSWEELARKKPTADGPTIIKARAKAAITGEESLSDFVHKMGGIDPRHAKGELSYLTVKQGGRPGLINESGFTPDLMREAAEEAGYHFDGSLDDFLVALRDDISGKKTYSTSRDFERNVDADYEDYLAKQNPAEPKKEAISFVAALKSPEFESSFRKLTESNATPEDTQTFRRIARKLGMENDKIEAAIKDAEAGRVEAIASQEIAAPVEAKAAGQAATRQAQDVNPQANKPVEQLPIDEPAFRAVRVERIKQKIGVAIKEERGSFSTKPTNEERGILPDLTDIAHSYIREAKGKSGFDVFQKFRRDMETQFSDGVEKLKPHLMAAWAQARKAAESEKGKAPEASPKAASAAATAETEAARMKAFSDALGEDVPGKTEPTAKHKPGEAYLEESPDQARRKPTLKDHAADVLNAPRTIMASADLSAPLRQGAILTLTEPRSGIAASRDMLRSISDKGFEKVKAELAAHPRAELAEQSGLYQATKASGSPVALAAREEAFMSRLVGKLPVIKQSEHAYVAYLDRLRMDTFSKYADELEKAGKTAAKNPKDFEDIAKFVNYATGRGDLPQVLDSLAPVLNGIFFSPRYAMSRVQILNPTTYAKMSPVARKIAMRKMFEFAGVTSMTLGLAKLAGAEVSLDPTSADFLKVKAGNTRYDLLAGFQQYMRFAAQMSKGLYNNFAGSKNERGKEPFDVATKFFRSKLAPVSSYAVDAATGKTFDNQKFNPIKGVGARLIPMFIKDAKEAWSDQESGKASKSAATVAAIFGAGVQTYSGNEKEKSALDSIPEVKRLGLDIPELKQKSEENEDAFKKRQSLSDKPLTREKGESSDEFKSRQDRINAQTQAEIDKLTSSAFYQKLTDAQKRKAILSRVEAIRKKETAKSSGKSKGLSLDSL